MADPTAHETRTIRRKGRRGASQAPLLFFAYEIDIIHFSGDRGLLPFSWAKGRRNSKQGKPEGTLKRLNEINLCGFAGV
jgi:hypothetical protein